MLVVFPPIFVADTKNFTLSFCSSFKRIQEAVSFSSFNFVITVVHYILSFVKNTIIFAEPQYSDFF